MSKKEKANVAWICGAYYLCSSLLEKIKNKYSHAELYHVDETVKFSDLYNNLASVSCFATCKLTIITEMPEMTDGDKKKFKDLLENLDESNLVVFFMLDPTKDKSFFNLVEKIGRVYQYDETVAVSAANEWLQKRCKELDITIENSALQSLIENTQTTQGGKSVSLDIFENTLQRLIAYDPNRKNYVIDDIIATAAFCENFVIWSLLSACDSKNFEECINQFNKSVSFHSNPIVALNEMLNIMTWKFRMLLSLKEMMANGATQQIAIEKTSSIRKVGFEGSGINAISKNQITQSGTNKGNSVAIWNAGVCNQSVNSFYGKKPQIELYNRKDLFVIVSCLEESLYWARTCKYENEAILIADIVFATICGKMNNDHVAKLKNSINRMREIYE